MLSERQEGKEKRVLERRRRYARKNVVGYENWSRIKRVPVSITKKYLWRKYVEQDGICALSGVK